MVFSSAPDTSREWSQAIDLLEHPVWPLVKLVQLLDLTLGSPGIPAILRELPEELEIEERIYVDPGKRLEGCVRHMEMFLGYKPGPEDLCIKADGVALDGERAQEAFVRQMVLEIELERINSLLCSPMGCNLCCIGPREEEKNLFFDIPLRDEELKLFPLPVVDTPETRNSTPYNQNDISIDGKAFYQQGNKIFVWKTGPSLILPRGSRCPNLSETNRCKIYPNRPVTCRMPSIFPYIIKWEEKGARGTYENKILAVTECPYVLPLKETIHQFASLWESDLVLTRNRM